VTTTPPSGSFVLDGQVCMRRRKFIALLGSAACAWPLAARAQQRERMRRIGVLLPATADNREFQARLGAFLQGLQQSGWSIGRNVQIDTRWATAKAAEIRARQQNWRRSRPMSSWPMAPRPWGRWCRRRALCRPQDEEPGGFGGEAGSGGGLGPLSAPVGTLSGPHTKLRHCVHRLSQAR
jgi:hypothetical protein